MKKILNLFLFCLLSISPVFAQNGKTLDVYWIDTEGGAATLIVTPTGESVLIDTGNPGGRDSERIFKVASGVAGLKRIDHLITTHFHIDHFGGAAELAQRMPIINLYDKGIPETLQEDPDFMQHIQPYRQMKTTKRQLIKPGATIKLQSAKGVAAPSLYCIGVDQQFVNKTPFALPANADTCEQAGEKPVDQTDNANSAVYVLDFGSFRFFDGGDLTWNVEQKLVCPTNLPGEVDLFQVNHHGLDNSNNPVMIAALAPTVAIFNNGTEKGCGPETFTALKNTPSVQAVYQVHKNLRADSHINTDEARIANLIADCQANYIKVSVSPDGKSYTVSIPATGHQQTFASKE